MFTSWKYITDEEKDERYNNTIKDFYYKGFLGLDGKFYQRKTAAGSIGTKGNSRAIPHLIKMLDDRNHELRMAAAESLGSIEDPTAVPYLIKRFERKKKLPVKLTIMDAFAKIKDPKTVPVLIKALSDNDDTIRRNASGKLGLIANPTAVPHLINALRDPEISNRESAGWALKKCIDSSSIPILKKALLRKKLF